MSCLASFPSVYLYIPRITRIYQAFFLRIFGFSRSDPPPRRSLSHLDRSSRWARGRSIISTDRHAGRSGHEVDPSGPPVPTEPQSHLLPQYRLSLGHLRAGRTSRRWAMKIPVRNPTDHAPTPHHTDKDLPETPHSLTETRWNAFCTARTQTPRSDHRRAVATLYADLSQETPYSPSQHMIAHHDCTT